MLLVKQCLIDKEDSVDPKWQYLQFYGLVKEKDTIQQEQWSKDIHSSPGRPQSQAQAPIILPLAWPQISTHSLQPQGLHHARLPCPSLSHGACSNSCPLSQWCHPHISFSVVPFPLACSLSQHQGLLQWVSSLHQFSSVQFSHSVMSDFLQPHESQHSRPPCPSPIPGVHSDSGPSSRWCHPAISSLCHPLLLLPPIPPNIRVFSNESTLSMRWPKYWSFSFSTIPSKEHPGLISFRMDWLDLLAVQGTLKSFLQNHSSKASIRH